MSDVKRCAACGKESPVSEMEICMHNQMHQYVCDSKCMRDFYNPPKKPSAAEQRIAALEAECERLREELETERARADAAVGDANDAERELAALKAPAPAQTEQQPAAWRWMYNGEPDGPYAFNYPLPDDEVVRRFLKAEHPRTVQPLYAAPIAQTAPQPADELVEALKEAKYRIEQGRVWNGMGWTLTGLHASGQQKALAAIDAALAAHRAEGVV